MNLTADPEPGRAKSNQHHSSHQGANEQTAHPKLRHDAGNHHDESASRSTDLCLRTAESRSNEAGHDCGVDACLRTHAAADGKCHRKGQRNKAHRYAGNKVMRKRLKAVVPKCLD